MIWSPDTCDCMIEHNIRLKWIKSIRNCRLHSNLRNQNHLDVVVSQNKRFNFSLGIVQTEKQQEITNLSKQVNKLKIRIERDKNNPNFDEDLPHEKPLTFFQNMRRFLKI